MRGSFSFRHNTHASQLCPAPSRDKVAAPRSQPSVLRKTVIDLRRGLSRAITDFLTRRWDKRHNVETGGRAPVATFESRIVGDNAASGYDVVSTSPRTFAYLAEKYFPYPRHTYTFVDIGSGKGRTLLMASEIGFSAVVGVEFVEPIAEQANRNIACYRGVNADRSPCQVVNADATDWVFPAGNLVVYFNNPFAPGLWRKMAQRLSQLACDGERSVTIILIGSFPDAIEFGSELLVESGNYTETAVGECPRFWDSYAAFPYVILRNKGAQPI